MNTYSIKITLKSPCLIGSGEGFGAVIDTDIVFDELGVPYIPSKRIKGCLRDSALEVCEIFKTSGIDLLKSDDIVSELFGRVGDERPGPAYFSNLTIENYADTHKWLTYLGDKYTDILNRQSVINHFTEIRQQTAIDEDNGVAKEHSLRTLRVAKKGLVFEGTIDIEGQKEEWLMLLFFACKNLRHMGTKRNRGFGVIECQVLDGSREINYIDKLEEICKP